MRNAGDVNVLVDPTVRQAARRLADLTNAVAVILFGSRARGDFRPDSDWDLCVVVPDNVKPRQFTAVSLWSSLSEFGVPIQVVPIRESVFAAKKGEINALSYDVHKEGIVLESAR